MTVKVVTFTASKTASLSCIALPQFESLQQLQREQAGFSRQGGHFGKVFVV